MSDISADIVGSSQPGGDTQADSSSSFSFNDLHEKAMAFGSEPATEAAPETPASTPVDPALPGEEQAPAAVDAENIDNASAAQLAQIADDQLVEVTVDGEKVTLPWSEARGGVMRQAKFTKEMQTLRRQQEEFETERQSLATVQQEREALVNFLKNPQLVKQFIEAQYPGLLAAQQAVQAQQQAGGSSPAGNADPDDIATIGQIQAAQQQVAQFVQQQMEQLQGQLAAREEQVTQTIEDRQAAARLGNEVNSTISQLFKEHPAIDKIVPNAEQMLRYEVLRMKPQTEQETIEAFKTVFGGWVENFEQAVGETTKSSALAKAKLQQNNIAPAGGTPVTPQATSFKTKDGQVDWNALREAALSRMG